MKVEIGSVRGLLMSERLPARVDRTQVTFNGIPRRPHELVRAAHPTPVTEKGHIDGSAAGAVSPIDYPAVLLELDLAALAPRQIDRSRNRVARG